MLKLDNVANQFHVKIIFTFDFGIKYVLRHLNIFGIYSNIANVLLCT